MTWVRDGECPKCEDGVLEVNDDIEPVHMVKPDQRFRYVRCRACGYRDQLPTD